jgi:hypothetical protein|tara:strand:+ start:753 stop:2702 length:1950 start_codon:yes stop_codon:yes gene_type:complete
MPDLTGQEISNSYKRLMQVKTSANEGITTTLRTIQSGDNADSPLQLNNSTLNVNGTFAIGGVNLTATVSSLNATADISGGEGYVVVSGTNIYKRSFSAGNGITLANADGVASNTGIALTSVISNIQSFGASAVSATTLDVAKTITSSIVSAVDIRGTTVSAVTLKGANATIVSTVSAAFFVGDGSGLTNVPSAEGGTTKHVKPGTGLAATVNGASATTITVSGTLNVNPNQSFGTVSVSTGLVVPQGAITFSVPVSGTSAVFTGNVSAANVYAATNVFVGGTAVPTAANVAAVSALTSVNKADIATNVAAITSANTVIAAVSALTSVNKAAITSINSVIGDGGNYATSAELATVSAALATSIGNTNTALATTSAALATSIGNSNTNIAAVSVLTSVNKADIATNVAAITSANTVIAAVSALTKTNLDAITSANTVIGAVSVLTKTNLDAITSINTVVANVSSTLATSIGNSNTNIAAVSVLASVNLARIVATSAALATSIGTRLPLAGGALTGILSATDVICSGVGVDVDALLGKDVRIAKAAVADIVSLSDGANISVDFNAGQNFAVQLAGNRTIDNPTNCVPGQTGSIFVIQDGTGGRTLSYGTNYKFPGGTAPTLSTGASACDRIDYITFTSTNLHAVATLNVSTA